MNKLNLLISIIIGIGAVCGCHLVHESDDTSNRSIQSHKGENNHNNEKTGIDKKPKSDSNTNKSRKPESNSETADSEDATDSSNSGEISNNDDNSTGDKGDAARLAGKWIWARTGSGTYNSGGSYVGSNGSRFTYEFSENGDVEFTGIMNVMQGGCRMQIFKSRHGRADLNSDTLTINWSPSSFSRDDSCDTAGNYQKTLPAETENLRVAFKNSAEQRQLCMTGQDEMCFSPAE